MATAVVSGAEAVQYAAGVIPHVPVTEATIGLLAAFMLLTILGITDSARVAILNPLIAFFALTVSVLLITRGDNLANLNNVMLYIRKNEHTNRAKIVTVVKDKSEIPPKIEGHLQFLDESYPDIDVEFLAVEGMFGPGLIQKLLKEWGIPVSLMFIGSPGSGFMYGLEELGGVRLII